MTWCSRETFHSSVSSLVEQLIIVQYFLLVGQLTIVQYFH